MIFKKLKTKSIYRAIFIFVILMIAQSCSKSTKISLTEFNIKDYVVPEVFNSNRVLFEYKNSDIEKYPLKYLLLEKKSETEYVYKFLNTNLQPLIGYVEKRSPNFIEITKLLRITGENFINEINITGYKIPLSFIKNKIYPLEFDWVDENDNDAQYNESLLKKLLNENDSIYWDNKVIKSIIIQSSDITTVYYPLMDTAFIMKMDTRYKYAYKIGLVEMLVVFDKDPNSAIKIQLVKKHNEDEILELIEKIKLEKNI